MIKWTRNNINNNNKKNPPGKKNPVLMDSALYSNIKRDLSSFAASCITFLIV